MQHTSNFSWVYTKSAKLEHDQIREGEYEYSCFARRSLLEIDHISSGERRFIPIRAIFFYG